MLGKGWRKGAVKYFCVCFSPLEIVASAFLCSGLIKICGAQCYH